MCQGGAYFDLSLLAGLRADRLDDLAAVTPDLPVIHLQAALIPAPHVDVRVLVLADELEVHDFVPAGERTCVHASMASLPPSHPWTTFPSPAGRISVLVEVNGLPRYAGEVRLHEELQQFASVDGTHGLTQTLPSHKKSVFRTLAASPHKRTPTFYLVSWTEGLLHGM